ncbi:hypothetical protein [Arthrobacter agilis]|uniref:hypothetical protein n=1 Tax=Arthrobacter agilis TaxID=37921 RepID=UPI0027845A79|nr:hypothetical protein [Arthrobacter agilis]MDQ0735156.1 hypothetical protein [Arthrobacter agilis]
MNRKEITDARAKAVQFILDSDAAIGRLDRELKDRSWGDGKPKASDHSSGSPETGQLRRTSLDLTRALARMRRP